MAVENGRRVHCIVESSRSAKEGWPRQVVPAAQESLFQAKTIVGYHSTARPTRATTRDDTRRWTLGRVYPLFVRCLGSGSVEALDSLSSGAASVHHGRFDALAATTARLGIESQGGRPSEFASANLLCTAVGSNDLSEETSECAEDTGTTKLVAAAQPMFEQVSSGAFGTTQ